LPRIIAVIPAFNEEENIAKVIIKAQKYANKIIVVDDGSSDMTSEIAEKLGAIVYKHKENLGKGEALKTGFELAKKMDFDVLVTLDADGQHDPEEIPILIEPIVKGEADMVIGSRKINKSEMPFHRRLGNKILDSATQLVAKIKINDTQSGFRAYTKQAIEKLEIKDHGMGVESQLIIEAIEKNLRIKEVPVKVKYGKGHSTYNFLRHGSYVLLTILRTVIEKSPLLYLGLPGLAISIIGLILAIWLLIIYNAERYFSIPIAVLALGGILLGIILVVTAIILYAIRTLHTRLREV
jgi:Glycosyltransferases involved in cell wall biogenesis